MEKRKIIETIEFDNYAYAKNVLEQSALKLEKIKIGLIVSAAATFCTVLGLIFGNINQSLFGAFMFFALVGSIASYIVGGGFKIALKAAKNLAIFGWFILPFPADIITGLVTLVIAIYGFMFIPLIFVFLNYRQQKKNHNDAEEYIKYCRPVEQTVE